MTVGHLCNLLEVFLAHLVEEVGDSIFVFLLLEACKVKQDKLSSPGER
jgi:hypothetical protein